MDAQSPIVLVVVVRPGPFPGGTSEFSVACFLPLSFGHPRDPQDENDWGCTKRNKEQSHQAFPLSSVIAIMLPLAEIGMLQFCFFICKKQTALTELGVLAI